MLRRLPKLNVKTGQKSIDRALERTLWSCLRKRVSSECGGFDSKKLHLVGRGKANDLR